MIRILFVTGLLIAASACSSSRTSPTVSGDLLSYQDFDLETVVALIKDGKHVTDLASLEKQINTPGSGINNVDVDKDGKVDHVAVQDKPGGDLNLEFVAIPSSTPEDKSTWTTVAEVSIDKSAGDKVTIEGGYPDYVSGHSSHYYHHSSNDGLLTGMLISHMLDPSYGGYYHDDWGYYNRRYYGGSYSTRSYPVRSSTSLSTSRSSYRSSAGVSTASVKPASKPSTYTVSSPRTKSTTVTSHKAAVSTSRSAPSSSSSSWGSSSRSAPSSSGSVRSSPSSSRGSSRGGK